ncbi:MAG: ABC transporter permease subunit [Phycisphaerales bacterium]
MAAIVLTWIVRALSLAWLTGPIFDKEMRVSSRRRRNYLLRFVYVGLFTLLLALIWAESVPYRSTSAYQSSRMAQAGQIIVTAILWFEFLTAQVIAIVMLSTSISDEIHHRTLGVLMTTPIGSFQIVVGKLLSKLLQLVLLLAISLPLLAIVRVFGGVPWDVLIAGLCVTLTTTLFVGSLSLFFSIFTRRAYSVILTTILAVAVLFALLPFLVAFLAYYPDRQPTAAFWRGLSHVNPYFVMGKLTQSLHWVRPLALAGWRVHCGVMLGASVLVLLLSMMLVRKAALRQAMGQTGLWSGRAARGPEENAATGHVRRVVGPPVLWRECSTPLLGRRKLTKIIGTLLLIAVLAMTYMSCYVEDALDEETTHVMYIVVLFAVGLLFTTVVPGTCIASEKESQTWPLLLATSIGEGQILVGKFGGVLRRCAPAWALLFLHVLVFAVVGYIHPVAVLQLAVVVAWVLVFLSCTGLYFSARFKHTTTAVIANMGFAATLWAVVPFTWAVLAEISRLHGTPLETYMDLNPVVHAAVIAMATARKSGLGEYDWIQGGMGGVVDATGWILLTGFIYVVVGLAVATWTGKRMRRNLP